ncbi:hypothetical protein I302_105352 [Kwoniella bestiolae CBS 10118]|uniref:Uncharacterized protein n=1 Tax=Kwoniella bestiolae CBS 10118 TaxID=1296100 RepID=A0A1B9FSV4_9TREE|nr:hypothetical protein I302_08636 [Kwoniella bestiolae CBS 10118]OCF21857.1 hypothetical protein I302_08636 [Kwoniella bestiolae CBS 10118]
MSILRRITNWCMNTFKLIISSSRPRITSSFNPPKPLPHLPDHVWLDIFKLPPQPKNGTLSPIRSNSTSRYMSDELKVRGQQDLANLMRVSKRFGDIASILLYEHESTSDPYKLFYGIDHTPTNDGRISKSQCLSRVRSITFVYPNSYTIESAFDWNKLSIYTMPQSIQDKNFIRMYIYTLHRTLHATRLLESVRSTDGDGNAGGLMANVKNITVGISPYAVDSRVWLIRQTAINKLKRVVHPSTEDKLVRSLLEMKEGISTRFAQELDYLTSASALRKICYHSSFGPWTYIPPPSKSVPTLSPSAGSGTGRQAPTLVNIFLDENFLQLRNSLHITPGTDTQWIISKSLVSLFIPPIWHLTTDQRVNSALPVLLKKLRKVVVKSILQFPKPTTHRGDTTRLTINLPVTIDSLKVAANHLKSGSNFAGTNLAGGPISERERNVIYGKLDGWMMNKGMSYYRARGLSVHVREATKGTPINMQMKKDSVECRCCGLFENV